MFLLSPCGHVFLLSPCTNAMLLSPCNNVSAVTLYQCNVSAVTLYVVTMFLLPPCHKYAGHNHSPALHIGCGLAIICSVKLLHFINRPSLITYEVQNRDTAYMQCMNFVLVYLEAVKNIVKLDKYEMT